MGKEGYFVIPHYVLHNDFQTFSPNQSFKREEKLKE